MPADEPAHVEILAHRREAGTGNVAPQPPECDPVEQVVFLYGVIIKTSGGPGLGVLALRMVLLATLPLGLLVVRFFRPAELTDLRRLPGMLGARSGPVV